jgi:adenine-specific DNA glycosylase
LGIVDRLPVKPAKAKTPTIRQTALVIRDAAGRFLILERPAGGLWEHLWEFPVLPYGPELNSPARLTDGIREALGLEVILDRPTHTVRHVLSHRQMVYRIRTACCTSLAGNYRTQKPQRLPICGDGSNGSAGRYAKARWLSGAQLQQGLVPLSTAVRKIAMAAGVWPEAG